MNRVRLLSESVINQIAAGEVIERPAGAIKELIENSIDAQSHHIRITLQAGGKAGFIIEDDGEGIIPADLPLVLQRHATSKIHDDMAGNADLVNLSFFGFRGEALACVSAVAHIQLISKHASSDIAYQIQASSHGIGTISPASLDKGTRIVVTDFFQNLPARLKFLKSERSEQMAIVDLVKKMALIHPEIAFTILSDGQKILHLSSMPAPQHLERVGAVLGQDFTRNALTVFHEKEGVILRGFIGFPTYHRGNGLHQHFYVNHRLIKDKIFSTLLRVAYQDYLAKDRFPVAVLFLDIPAESVDVNVHPTKSEVRFERPEWVKGFFVQTIRQTLATMTHQVSSHHTQKMVQQLQKSPSLAPSIQTALPLHMPSMKNVHVQNLHVQEKTAFSPSFAIPPALGFPLQAPLMAVPTPKNIPNTETSVDSMRVDTITPPPQTPSAPLTPPMGFAKAQIHDCYILSQTENELLIIDQHAAHERIMLEKLRDSLQKGGLMPHPLLIPDIIAIPETEKEYLLHHMGLLKKFGLEIEAFGEGQILVRSVPQFLLKANIKQLILDIADDCHDLNATNTLESKLSHLCATFACHHSIRAGRTLHLDEMNHLLREMEEIPASGQCNHGRPTYIKLSKNDIERLFGRK